MGQVLVRLWSGVLKFLARYDAEAVHNLSIWVIKVLGFLGLLKYLCGHCLARNYPSRLGSFLLKHPVGLAAGFDKNAEILRYLPDMGFSFAEVGTITARPQSGNDKPRLFRDLPKKALFNRMGFNNAGADRVFEKISKVKASLPTNFVLGINVGKNKDTPAELAAKDYALLCSKFARLADYLVINVSSPNTPGLRDLQSHDSLREIVEASLAAIRSVGVATPLFVKLAPEIDFEELKALMKSLEIWGVSGFILSNTLAGNRGALGGGWSGAPLTERAREVLRVARSVTRLPIVSVGGILTPEEAQTRMDLGASAIQVYSGWIYSGPVFVNLITRHLGSRDSSAT